MSEPTELRVCMDIGSQCHRVGIGLSSGEMLETFDLPHLPNDIKKFFTKIESYKARYSLPVAIAMEGYNGHARPIDKEALAKGYRVLNVNNHKLAQFKKVFPAPFKSDPEDVQKMFELFSLQDHLPMAKNVLEEIYQAPHENEKLKRLTRRRLALVVEKVAIVNRLQSDVNAVSPGLMRITKSTDNLWFLHFLSARDDICKLARIQEKGLLALKGVGKRYLQDINAWQKTATFSVDVAWVGSMIIRDANRILELQKEIKQLEKSIEEISLESDMAIRIKTIVGFGNISAAVLAGEIGVFKRFKSESSLALYTGMALLDNSSGTYDGTKKSIHVNKHCKRALMTAIARHIDHCPESKVYYDRKRSEGKKHNQAVRSLGRHLIRVIWSMLKNERDYELRELIDKEAADKK